MPAIEVSHPHKKYRLGAIQGLKQTLLHTAARLNGNEAQGRTLSKALVADSSAARFDLESIIEDAWKWECKVCPPSLVEPKQLRA